MSKINKVQAVILAGGQGSRLRPYTTVIPKPLMPVGEYPIIEIVVRQLKYYGFKHIAVSTGYLSNLIEAYLGDGSRWGVDISYVHEEKPLGTAGALKLVKNLDEDVLTINGDTLTDLNLRTLLTYHKKSKSAATIAMKKRVLQVNFGVLEFNEKKELTDYIEKPQHHSYVSMGVNIINKSCQQLIAANESLGIPDLMLRLRDKNKKVSCFDVKGLWLDLGRLDDLEEAQEIWRKNKNKFIKKSR